MTRVARGKDEADTRFHLPRWLTVAAGAIGSTLGLASGLYSAEFRAALEASFRQVNTTALYPIVATVVSSASTVAIYKWLAVRKRRPLITQGAIEIRADVLPMTAATTPDFVVGRNLRYIEARRESDDLIVFLHGLGLDANDFRAYMAESRYHCIALTLYGLNAEEKSDEHYVPISLDSHLRLLVYALGKLRDDHPRKRMTLVGFSFGADLILLLGEAAPQAVTGLRIHRAVLLDPNVNRSTTTISGQVARVEGATPLSQLVEILSSATEVVEFRYLCEYLYKIMSKNFAQVQRHARELVARWDHDSNDFFLDLVGRLAQQLGGVHIVLSLNFERLFNEIAHGAAGRGLDANSFECSTCDHFELISPGFLKDRLEGLL